MIGGAIKKHIDVNNLDVEALQKKAHAEAEKWSKEFEEGIKSFEDLKKGAGSLFGGLFQNK